MKNPIPGVITVVKIMFRIILYNWKANTDYIIYSVNDNLIYQEIFKCVNCSFICKALLHNKVIRFRTLKSYDTLLS